LSRRQEGQGKKTPSSGGHRGLGAKGESPRGQNVVDQEGIKPLLDGAKELFPRLSHLWLDAGYRGQEKGRGWVEKALGWSVELVERPRKAAPEEVLMSWAEELAKEGKIVELGRSFCPAGISGPPTPLGGGTLLCLEICHNRRMSKDYEKLCATSEALVYAAMSRLMLRRLART
jgi:putative transposase